DDAASDHEALRPGQAPVARVEVASDVAVPYRLEPQAELAGHLSQDLDVHAGSVGVPGHQRRIRVRDASPEYARLLGLAQGGVGREERHREYQTSHYQEREQVAAQ